MIQASLTVGPFAANCYIIGSQTTQHGIIIDPGDASKNILSRVKELSLDIKYIILTHGHADHIGALKDIKEATSAQVAIHNADARLLQDRFMGFLLGLSYPSAPAADRLLTNGDTIGIGDLKFSVLHTPGHTPGSICLLREGIVFTGDTLFSSGIGRSDLPGGNHQQLMISIRTKLLLLPDDTKVYPGHGPETTIGDERRDNPFLGNSA